MVSLALMEYSEANIFDRSGVLIPQDGPFSNIEQGNSLPLQEKGQVRRFLQGHTDWITKHASRVQNQRTSYSHTTGQDSRLPFYSSQTNSNALGLDTAGKRMVVESGLHYTAAQWEEISQEMNILLSPASYATKGLPILDTAQGRFVQSCINYHLSDEVTQDKKISQLETTHFFIYFCVQVAKICQSNFTIEWEALSVFLQLSWVWALCPNHPTLGEDTVCLNELDQQDEETGEFGFIITDTNELYINDAIENYCFAVWKYAVDYHGGTQAPSASPSSKPSVSPTAHPSSIPTSTPTRAPTAKPSSVPTLKPSHSPTGFPSLSPSLSPTGMPSPSPTASGIPTSSPTEMPSMIGSMAPSSSSKPTHVPTAKPTTKPSSHPSVSPTMEPTPVLSSSPSSSPTVVQPERVLFTYILGFLNDPEKDPYEAMTLDDSAGYVYIMDDVKVTIHKFLFEMVGRRKTTLNQKSRRLEGIEIATPDPINSINTRKLFNEDPCPPEFAISDACVIVVTEVLLYANPETYTRSDVENFVDGPMRASMANGEFVANMSTSDVREVMYLGLGDLSENGGLPRKDATRNVIIGSGEIAGVTTAAVFIAALIAMFTIGRNRAKDDRVDPSEEFNEDDLVPLSPAKTRKLNKPAVQMDLESGDVILVSSSDSVKSESSEEIDSIDKEADILIGKLDAAVSAGDWAAVAAIAGDLSTNDDASSAYSSTNSDSKGTPQSPRSGLSKSNAKRAEKIDELIKAGDWNAVGATAAAFSSAGSSSGSSYTSGDDGATEVVKENITQEKKKTLLDFIAGPWQSLAAGLALGKGNDTKEIEVSHEVSESDGVSSLSGGLSPARKKELSEFEPTVSSPTAYAGISSESEVTDDDSRPILGGTSNKSTKRGWRNRIPSLRKKQNSQKTEARALALQEDSSVSSWSHGDSSAEVLPYSGRRPPKDEMPEEMKVFGEEFGLAAAEHAMEHDDENDNISQKSSNSLRDELDKAIESGDWATLEAQTNKMFDLDAQDEKVDSRTKVPIPLTNNLSFDDSDDSEKGWSTGSKSSPSQDDSEEIDDERIAYLERLIETDDWQGVVGSSMIHNAEDSSLHSSTTGEDTRY